MQSHNITLTTESNQLASTVYSILDSRIQFLEHQLEDEIETPIQTSNEGCFISHYEQLMSLYGKINKVLKQLQVLRAWVKAENASLIIELLNNESFMSYPEPQLEAMIKMNKIELYNYS